MMLGHMYVLTNAIAVDEYDRYIGRMFLHIACKVQDGWVVGASKDQGGHNKAAMCIGDRVDSALCNKLEWIISLLQFAR